MMNCMALVTNGRVLRLLRDSSRLIKLTYLEFDLDRIFTDGLFADFAVLYRLLHATRLPLDYDIATESLIERYHQDSLEQGTRIREGLRKSVTEALEILGTGFLSHSSNDPLRKMVKEDQLRQDAYFNYLLRLVYRLLFVMVIEERGVVFPIGTAPRFVRIYVQHYSVQRLRRLAITRGLKTKRFHDAWASLLSTFQLFENPDQAAKFGMTALGGQLFHPGSLGPLATNCLDNATLLSALDRLCYFDDLKTGQRTPVNFGALATEEFGSVYESLLELHPKIETLPTLYFGFLEAAGNERKTSGSYYTPASLVDCLLDSALDPVIEERINNYAELGYVSADKGLLAIKVCDPACGSGHFLIAAAQRIARRLALLRSNGDEPPPDEKRHALREVIGHCIFGVDINAMSVELCKLGLWLEAVEPGKPLTFLDHHIKCGNSLLGATPRAIKDGIPDDAYKPITGDTREAVNWMKKLNKDAKAGQGDLFDFTSDDPWGQFENLPAAIAQLENLSDETLEALQTKESVYREIVEGSDYDNVHLQHDAWCAAFVWDKCKIELGTELTSRQLRNIVHNPLSISFWQRQQIRQLAKQYRFFHWHLEYPAVFGAEGNGGFDCILGNPPWERTAFEEVPYFVTRVSEIAEAETTAQRQAMIAELKLKQPDIWTTYQYDLRFSQGQEHIVNNGGSFSFSSSGRTNTFALFTELALKHTKTNGLIGLVIPTALATDTPYAEFWGDIVKNRTVVSMFDFENRGFFFPNVHSSYKFSLFTFRPNIHPGTKSRFGFYLTDVLQTQKSENTFEISQSVVAQINPTTNLLPICRSIRDFKLLTDLHKTKWMLALQAKPWVGFTSSATSNIWKFNENEIFPEDGFVSLCEAKCIHQFNHRFATYIDTSREAKLAGNPNGFVEKKSPEAKIVTRYLVPREAWLNHISSRQSYTSAVCGYRDVARATDERTMISAIIPLAGFMQPLNGISHQSPKKILRLVACLNSFVLDFACRQKTPGTHVNVTICKQLPSVPDSEYNRIDSFVNETGGDWVLRRAIELTYVSWDLEAFASDCDFNCPPFEWDENRRFELRCELDAVFFHLYDIAHTDVDYIMETFPIVKRKDLAQYGTYRTKNKILEIYDDFAEALRNGQTFISTLDPPPADSRCCHPSKQ